MGQECAKTSSVEPEPTVPSAMDPSSENAGYYGTAPAKEILEPILQNRSEFVQVTKKTLPSATVGNVKQTPALKFGQGLGKSKIQTRPKMPLWRPNTLYPKSDYHQKIQVQKGCPIMSIRTDPGREFDNEVQFGAFCDANGITHNFSAPRTLQSNGVVERKNRTLQEMIRTMLNE
ncbi:retrovirus-related pol polyprotein from transposon TNT 1-94 [Tanacetum coccineum]|uniref:Retrovirus-related pol polyprotein from transposon TNT 1-94 n=1 Tax=Tanacetum coccineum TaxID=301880 RepID=A0ABQ5HVA4_9ASTR